jgi:hypothetical protein
MSANAALTTVAQPDLVAQKGRLIVALDTPPLRRGVFAFTVSGPRCASRAVSFHALHRWSAGARNLVEPYIRIRAWAQSRFYGFAVL